MKTLQENYYKLKYKSLKKLQEDYSKLNYKHMKTLQYINIIQKSKLDDQIKQVLSIIFSDWDAVVEIANRKKLKTVGDFRQALYKELGVAPPIILSWKHLYINQATFFKAVKCLI